MESEEKSIKKYPRKKTRVMLSFDAKQLAKISKRFKNLSGRKLAYAIEAHLLNLRKRKFNPIIPPGFFDYGAAVNTLEFIEKGIETQTLTLKEVKELVTSAISRLKKR